MQFDLCFVRGNCVGRTVLVSDNQRIVFGRSRDSSIQFQDPMISRHHCEIANLKHGLSVFDLKSWNGTYVNGTRISGPTPLIDGDRITIGKTLFEIKKARPTEQSQNRGEGIDLLVEGSTRDGLKMDSGWEKDNPRAQNHTGGIDWDPDMVTGYRIDYKIGSGAVGTVFRARNKTSGRVVALKVVDPIYASSPNGIKRFMRAARICQEIVHPNIMRIRELGNSGGVYFIAMEHIAGKEVGAIINRYDRITMNSALQITIQLTEALQYAYERSIIHRDIKPKNIMITRSGKAKLVDFGLAKRCTYGASPTVTEPGEAVGTLAYMPPEQLDDALHADHRSDIYSLGATLYHMVTGTHPFNEPSFAEFVTSIMTRQPDRLQDIFSSIPVELNPIINKSMAKKPDDRYQTPREFGNDLRDLAKKLSCEKHVTSPFSKTAKMKTPPEL